MPSTYCKDKMRTKFILTQMKCTWINNNVQNNIKKKKTNKKSSNKGKNRSQVRRNYHNIVN